MKKYFLPSIAVLTTFALTAVARADSITVPNFSFESPAIPSGSTTVSSTADMSTTNTGIITGWTVDTSRANGEQFGVVTASSALNSAGTSDGSQLGFLDAFYNGPDALTLSTSTSATIQANTTYTLTFALGAPVNPPQGLGTAGQDVAPTDTISLLANGTAFSSTLVQDTSVPEGTVADFSTTFTTGTTDSIIGQQLGISLFAIKDSYPVVGDPGFEETVFDNVRLTEVSAVPEPATWALMLGGVAFLVLLTQRNLRRV
jgi:hypothetical protein